MDPRVGLGHLCIGEAVPMPTCTESALSATDVLRLVEYHVVTAGQEHEGSVAGELTWLAERIEDLAISVRLDGVSETCALIADDHRKIGGPTAPWMGAWAEGPVDVGPLGHGREAAYNRGCRCERCREARRLAETGRRRRRGVRSRAEVRAAGLARHGTITCYRYYGCRCDGCRRANAEYCRDQRAKRRRRATEEGGPQADDRGSKRRGAG